MTVTGEQLALYAAAMAGLWAVPGPVWVALTARALSGGMAGAWPLAVGVALGDLIWPLCAILGLAWVLSLYGDALSLLRWVAAGVFIVMGLLLIRAPARVPGADSRMTRPGIWAGFSVGVAAVIGNPKAILFYMGFLPGFFDLSQVTAPDIAAILAISA
ncbi:MAG: LysE family transporter, partial [Roseovarius sp.]|nr:LysE family transporter [Roseovarius sp.]